MAQDQSKPPAVPAASCRSGDLPGGEVPARRYLLFVLVASAGCLLDLVTKRWVFDWRGMPGDQPIWWLWEGYVGIETALNVGSLGGLQLGGPERSVQLLALISCLALLGAVVWFVWGRLGTSRSMTIVVACIVAGILGNLYDRLGLWSIGENGEPAIRAVRDWIRLSVGRHVWPNFNVADSLLVCSTAWLVWSSFREPVAGQDDPSVAGCRPREAS